MGKSVTKILNCISYLVLKWKLLSIEPISCLELR